MIFRFTKRKVAPATEAKIEALLDEIKDAIDRLNTIRGKYLRADAARELVDYLVLHQLQGF